MLYVVDNNNTLIAPSKAWILATQTAEGRGFESHSRHRCIHVRVYFCVVLALRRTDPSSKGPYQLQKDVKKLAENSPKRPRRQSSN
jgi:hypothetical protein